MKHAEVVVLSLSLPASSVLRYELATTITFLRTANLINVLKIVLFRGHSDTDWFRHRTLPYSSVCKYSATSL